VPLHPHLLEMGFREFASLKRGTAPLFYSIARQRNPKRKNPTYTSVGNKLGEWVRGLGIKDPLVAPNHGWRHRFKTIARTVRMNPETRDAIQGTFHVPMGRTTETIRRTSCSPRSRSCRGTRSLRLSKKTVAGDRKVQGISPRDRAM
jgi:integrase